MKILVTGGAGFMGSHLVDRLVGEHEVTVLDSLVNGKTGNLNRKAEFVEGDVRNDRLVGEIIGGMDLVYHLAAQISVQKSMKNPSETMEVNVEGTKNLVKNLPRNARFVYFSSAAVYGEQKEFPIKENSRLNSLSPYSESKIMAERLCKPDHIILRPFNAYGPRQDPESPYSGVISKFIGNAKQERDLKIYGDGLQTRDFIHVRDVVSAAILLGTQNHGGTYNLGTGKETRILDLAKIVLKITKKDLKIRKETGQEGDIKRSVADISKLRSVGWRPGYDLEKGLSELL